MASNWYTILNGLFTDTIDIDQCGRNLCTFTPNTHVYRCMCDIMHICNLTLDSG